VSGLPVVMLTTTGAKTGRQRTRPVLGIPDGERLILVGSNFGRPHHPAWYHNLRAGPRAIGTSSAACRSIPAGRGTGSGPSIAAYR
jgi:deazaflavin-dependent oxidoreductase (nitroreductase family)